MEFSENDYSAYDYLDFEVMPIALTMDQIRQYSPPENPAKITDPRAKDFIREHGGSSWEVDALRPDVLNQILEDAIKSVIDLSIYNDIIEQEEEGRNTLKSLEKYL